MSEEKVDNLQPIRYHTEHTKCYTYFKIVGDFDPDTISEILGIPAEKSWKIGDRRKDGSKYPFAMWRFGTCDEYAFETDKQMMKTIAPLLLKTSELKEIKRRFDVDFTLEVVPTVRWDESTPTLSPSLEVMRFCCETETAIDIDLYVSCPDDCGEDVIWEL